MAAAGLTLDDALAAVQELSRQRGFPSDDEGVASLARGLVKACERGVSVDDLIEAAKSASQYCPTDWDLLQIADELVAARRPAWDWPHTKCRFGRCDGSGWVQVFFLVTRERNANGSNYARRDSITHEAYDHLRQQKMPPTQGLYEGVKRCACKIPAQEMGESQ